MMCFLQPVDRLILTGILKQKTHRPLVICCICQCLMGWENYREFCRNLVGECITIKWSNCLYNLAHSGSAMQRCAGHCSGWWHSSPKKIQNFFFQEMKSTCRDQARKSKKKFVFLHFCNFQQKKTENFANPEIPLLLSKPMTASTFGAFHVYS